MKRTPLRKGKGFAASPGPLEDCVLAHPLRVDFARKKAEEMGLPVRLSRLCPLTDIYVVRPSELPFFEGWPSSEA